MAEIVSLSVTDASNTARFPEGQAPSTVNNGARALEGMLARNIRDTQGYITAAGTANAITIALNATTAAEATGERIVFKAAATNTAATTVTVTPSGGAARSARNIYRNGAALTGGEIISGSYYTLDWDGTQYQLGNPNPVALITGRNLLINGEMKVAQRGATITSPADAAYTLDQWRYGTAGAGAVTITQSTTVPNSTFTNSLKVDVTTADASIAAADRYTIEQVIEGLRCSRVGFGTSAAQAVTLSFWVRVDSAALSFPATFSGALWNSAGNRCYPFTYSVAASATWQKITTTIAGDTTGTWLQTSGVGLRLILALDVGSNDLGTPGAWAAAGTRGATGQCNFMGNTANDLYLTGVQLEVGSVATPFEYRGYGEELQGCQRYLWRKTRVASTDFIAPGFNVGTTVGLVGLNFPVPMRAAPNGSVSNNADFVVRHTGGSIDTTSITFNNTTTENVVLEFVVAAGLTAGQGCWGGFDATAGGYIQLSAEL